jgi:hypothetical protein
MLKHVGCMVHAFKQRLFTTMAMVRHKKESINDGVSQELAIGEKNKHKRTRFGEWMQMLRELLAMTI